jgi:hypothetical protein
MPTFSSAICGSKRNGAPKRACWEGEWGKVSDLGGADFCMRIKSRFPASSWSSDSVISSKGTHNLAAYARSACRSCMPAGMSSMVFSSTRATRAGTMLGGARHVSVQTTRRLSRFSSKSTRCARAASEGSVSVAVDACTCAGVHFPCGCAEAGIAHYAQDHGHGTVVFGEACVAACAWLCGRLRLLTRPCCSRILDPEQVGIRPRGDSQPACRRG